MPKFFIILPDSAGLVNRSLPLGQAHMARCTSGRVLMKKSNFVLCWSFTCVPNSSLNCPNVFRFEAQLFCCFPVLKNCTSTI